MQPALFVLFLSVLSTSSAFEVLGIFGNNQKSNYTLVENWTGKRMFHYPELCLSILHTVFHACRLYQRFHVLE